MSSAGQQVLAGRIPGETIGTPSERTTSSGTFTAETQIDTITVPLVDGRKYKITWLGHISSSVADGYARCRIRQDSSSGTQIQLRQVITGVAAQSFPVPMIVYYTATATADKTFVVTCNRQAGTGNITAAAAVDTPTVLFVEYVSG